MMWVLWPLTKCSETCLIKCTAYRTFRVEWTWFGECWIWRLEGEKGEKI